MGEQMSFSEFVDAWELFRDPVLTAVAAGAVLGFLSVYVVLRRMVFFSATAAQAAGLGVAVGYYLQAHHAMHVSPKHVAIAFSIASAALVVFEPRRLGLSREAVLGLSFTFASGATIYLGSRIPNDMSDIQAIVFGSAVVVLPEDFHAILLAGAVILVLHLWWFRGLVFASFNPDSARVQGLPVGLLDGFLFASIGIMVGLVAQGLGAMPTFALSTLPGVAALLLWRGHLLISFVTAMIFGGAIGAGGYVVGSLRSASVGASQSLVAAMLVLACLVIRGAISFVRRRPSAA